MVNYFSSGFFVINHRRISLVNGQGYFSFMGLSDTFTYLLHSLLYTLGCSTRKASDGSPKLNHFRYYIVGRSPLDSAYGYYGRFGGVNTSADNGLKGRNALSGYYYRINGFMWSRSMSANSTNNYVKLVRCRH